MKIVPNWKMFGLKIVQNSKKFKHENSSNTKNVQIKKYSKINLQN
jgi:hypothetical protein